MNMNWTKKEKDGEARSLSKFMVQQIAERVGWKGDSYSDGSGAYLNYMYLNQYCGDLGELVESLSHC